MRVNINFLPVRWWGNCVVPIDRCDTRVLLINLNIDRNDARDNDRSFAWIVDQNKNGYLVKKSSPNFRVIFDRL